MQGAQAVLAVVAPPGRLAIDREDRLLHAGGRHGLGAERLQPVGEAGPEGIRPQAHQDPAEDILARDALGQVECGDEEFLLEGGPSGDGRRPAGTGQDRHHGDDDDTDQGMLAIDGTARVLQLPEVPHNFIPSDPPHVRHGPSSVARLKRSDTEDDRQTIIRTELDPGCRVYQELALAPAVVATWSTAAPPEPMPEMSE